MLTLCHFRKCVVFIYIRNAYPYPNLKHNKHALNYFIPSFQMYILYFGDSESLYNGCQTVLVYIIKHSKLRKVQKLI